MKPTMVARTAALLSPIVLLGTALALASPVQAHGYVSGPYSRAAACKMALNSGCGGIVYEPQSLEAPKGFSAAGPADGRIASAGTAFTELDQQSYGRWYKNAIGTGPLTINWTYTAAHRTSKWSYYMTKQNWDPNAPLKRADLELITTVAHDGSAANTRPAHAITVPANRSGYHVILAVWDVADTVNAFYNVIDVNVTPGGGDGSAPTAPDKVLVTVVTAAAGALPDTQAPSAPSGLHSMGESESTVDLMWSPSTDNVGVKNYSVLRDGLVVAQTKATSYTDSGRVAGVTYRYEIIATDAAGNASPRSGTLTVATKAAATSAGSGSASPWSARGRYIVGDLVTNGGATYRCIQAYQGNGDPNWILAPSLWSRVA
jgi:chitin-binding protein